MEKQRLTANGHPGTQSQPLPSQNVTGSSPQQRHEASTSSASMVMKSANLAPAPHGSNGSSKGVLGTSASASRVGAQATVPSAPSSGLSNISSKPSSSSLTGTGTFDRQVNARVERELTSTVAAANRRAPPPPPTQSGVAARKVGTSSPSHAVTSTSNHSTLVASSSTQNVSPTKSALPSVASKPKPK